MWPFSKWYRSKDQPSLGSTDPHQQSTPSQNNIDDSNPPTTRTVKPQRAWVPSQSKPFLQVFWWGYRMSVNHFLSLHPTNHSHPHPQISSPTYPLNPNRQNSRRIHTRRNVKRNSILDFQRPINPSHTNTFSTFSHASSRIISIFRSY